MKKSGFYVFGMLTILLALSLAACANGTAGGTETKFEGTWTKDTYKIIVAGNEYTIQINNGINYRKGNFTFTDSTFSVADTHEWSNNAWVAFNPEDPPLPVDFGYVLNGNTLTISGGTGNNQVFNGDWTR